MSASDAHRTAMASAASLLRSMPVSERQYCGIRVIVTASIVVAVPTADIPFGTVCIVTETWAESNHLPLGA